MVGVVQRPHARCPNEVGGGTERGAGAKSTTVYFALGKLYRGASAAIADALWIRMRIRVQSLVGWLPRWLCARYTL